jgi:hypothetical protein
LESLKVLESLKDYRKFNKKISIYNFASANVRESTGGSLAITMIISICNKYIIYFLERLKDYRR